MLDTGHLGGTPAQELLQGQDCPVSPIPGQSTILIDKGALEMLKGGSTF